MKNKKEVVTFKVDDDLFEALKDIPNRSEFIRTAVLNELNSKCPLCKGSGVITPHQKSHWDDFTVDHTVEECDDCHGLHLVCNNER